MSLRIFEGSGVGASTCGRGGPGARLGVTRRSFLRASVGAAGGMAAFAAAISPLRELTSEHIPSLEQFLQKHYKEMTPDEMEAALDRIREKVEHRYKVRPNIRDIKPMDGVEFIYALNLSRCIGCRRCVHACVAENNQSRDPEIQYIRVLEMPRGTTDINQGNHHYDRATVPDENHFYMPIQCHQCANPPCVKVCPVEATWQEPDGITVIDYDWCIGCRYCEAACPYWARRFNFQQPKLARPDEIAADPNIEASRLNPEMSYLSNRPRRQGVMEKCHFCLHRTRQGRMPACLEICPVGARKFGNVLDPNSDVSNILKTKRVFVLKAELGTLPRFFYYFDERDPTAQDLPAMEHGGVAPKAPEESR
ncbi:MAG: 4Fe-4S dicluster domain-containing protein [Phycisphaerales bacterium]|nr:4Fe-4S dicluster domain-containing protein [Phycisphaerales bacterium]